MIRRHPSRARLVEWLDGNAPDLDEHIDTCAKCADRLGELSTPTSPLHDPLVALLDPPADLAPTIRTRFDERARNRADLTLLADLLVLPLHVSRSFGDDQPPTDDPENPHA